MARLSVIICTYNRWKHLLEVLQAIEDQVLSANCEIVVVDNNSTDQTKEIVSEFSSVSKLSMRYFLEPNQGVSFARNRGVTETKSELVAFLDDDVVPAPHWISSLINGFDQYHADSIGGPVFPVWPHEPLSPPAFHDGICGLFGLLDRGSQVIQTRAYISNFLLGGNVAYRRSVFEDLGLFRTDLGRTATTLCGGEDSEMIQRVLKAGRLAVYDPKILVKHKIGPDRMKLSYLRKWNFDMGRSTVKISKFGGSIFLNLIADCFTNGIFALFYYVARIEKKAMIAEENFWWKWGMFVELMRGSGIKNG